ncbi:site-2 protease family protein [Paraconexibacter sp.]|uniref:site-2 protease family protein n=1 Tax=Paraconexibacter sp. TaxID=2949640 RepID=UPI0035636912
MGGNVIRLGRLAGIPFGVHPLWLVIVVLLTTSLGGAYYPDAVPDLSDGAAYALGLASTLALFAGIVAHELGHAVVARRHGVEIEEIDLWLLGGVARMANEPTYPKAEFRFALAGPAVTAMLLGAFGALRLGLGAEMSDWVRAFVDYQLYVNAAILFFNMLPAFPLDGGRVLRSLLWMRSGDRDTATISAGTIGAGFGWGFVFLGVMITLEGANGIMLALVGAFIIVAARGERARASLHHAVGDLTVVDVMERAPITVPAEMSAELAVERIVRPHPHAAFPVVDGDGLALGLLTLTSLRQMPRIQRERVTVGDLVVSGPGVVVGRDTALGDLVMDTQFAEIGRAVVVEDDRTVAGLVSMTDVQRRLLLAAPGASLQPMTSAR